MHVAGNETGAHTSGICSVFLPYGRTLGHRLSAIPRTRWTHAPGDCPARGSQDTTSGQLRPKPRTLYKSLGRVGECRASCGHLLGSAKLTQGSFLLHPGAMELTRTFKASSCSVPGRDSVYLSGRRSLGPSCQQAALLQQEDAGLDLHPVCNPV